MANGAQQENHSVCDLRALSTNIWGRLHAMQITVHTHSPSFTNRIAKETARVSGIFVQGTRQVARMRNIRKHLQSKLVSVIAPNSKDHKQQT